MARILIPIGTRLRSDLRFTPQEEILRVAEYPMRREGIDKNHPSIASSSCTTLRLRQSRTTSTAGLSATSRIQRRSRRGSGRPRSTTGPTIGTRLLPASSAPQAAQWRPRDHRSDAGRPPLHQKRVPRRPVGHGRDAHGHAPAETNRVAGISRDC